MATLMVVSPASDDIPTKPCRRSLPQSDLNHRQQYRSALRNKYSCRVQNGTPPPSKIAWRKRPVLHLGVLRRNKTYSVPQIRRTSAKTAKAVTKGVLDLSGLQEWIPGDPARPDPKPAPHADVTVTRDPATSPRFPAARSVLPVYAE